ncbi:AfsR/SARP family transcriptional regulator [Nocardiopsis quinghaiensis]|uniref:AfsR/SARP family transcriptional regulator n=1 Tax=Nocardiopsis quinghaiensis TaxID=464995 RepID=UPI001CC241D7|nr:AfsR/SARP family transcriptional regulator [Nocardiopsis quinghaiensis]
MGEPTFRVLGPLQVRSHEARVPIPPGRQQVVLSALLLEVGKVVSTDYLIDAIWDEDPPDTARTQVQICVSKLRKRLAPAGVDLLTRVSGYIIEVDPGRIDAGHAERLSGRAHAARRDGDTERASALCREATRLWSGPVLSGVPSRLLATKAARLEEKRVNLVETYLDLDLGLGRHQELVGEISELVKEHPLRERLRGQLMLALFRSGRRAEALESYRRGRELLLEELGLDPGEELRALEHAILNDDSSLRLEPSAPPSFPSRASPDGHDGADRDEPAAAMRERARPSQLPADSADFVGRSEWIDAIESTLTTTGPAVGVALIVGQPGIGKSSLAVHAGHRLGAHRFPDGQLYCDLRGSRREPADTAEVLGRFLRALGIPGQGLPESTDERAELYRSLMSARKVLVVLDDAASERQVAALLPGSPGCGVIVTSRARLTGIPGARVIGLDVLGEDQAVDLLRRVLGPERVDAEPAAVSALVASVGMLPLALRIIAARLGAREHWSLASMVDRLADERHRLDELAHGELTVRASISLTHDGLHETSRRLLALMTLADGPHQPGWVAGALLGDDGPSSLDLLEPLVDTQMMEVTGVDAQGEPRYRFHEVIRLFAKERLAEVPARVGAEATARLVGGWLMMVDEANRRVQGGDYLFLHGSAPRWQLPPRAVSTALAQPMAWLEGEQANITAAVDLAAEAGLDELCWDLAGALRPHFNRRGWLDQWEATTERALALARERKNQAGIAALSFSLGSLNLDRRRYAESGRWMTRALVGFAELGDELGKAMCHRELAQLAQLDGDDEGALDFCARAFRGFQLVEDTAGLGRTLLLSGHVHTRAGHVERGMKELDRALRHMDEVGDPRDRAQVLRRIGQSHLQRGEHREALRRLTEAFDLVRGLGDPIGEGYLLHDLGQVHGLLGLHQQACSFLRRSLAVREQILDRRGAAKSGVALARQLLELGEQDQAAELTQFSARVLDELRSEDRRAEPTDFLASSCP